MYWVIPHIFLVSRSNHTSGHIASELSLRRAQRIRWLLLFLVPQARKQLEACTHCLDAEASLCLKKSQSAIVEQNRERLKKLFDMAVWECNMYSITPCQLEQTFNTLIWGYLSSRKKDSMESHCSAQCRQGWTRMFHFFTWIPSVYTVYTALVFDHFLLKTW